MGAKNKKEILIVMCPNSSSAMNNPCSLYSVSNAIPSDSPFVTLIGTTEN